jgi:hypothetical protein
MRRPILLTALTVVSLLFGGLFAGPVSATTNYAESGIGACSVSVSVTNIFPINSYSNGVGDIELNSVPGTCTYMGLRVRIHRCDGTYSTSAEQGSFNPGTSGGGPLRLYKGYQFSCYSARVDAVIFRASNGSLWLPTQDPAPKYVTYNGSSCYPDICTYP